MDNKNEQKNMTLEKLIAKAQGVSLSAVKKSEIRENLEAFVDENPLLNSLVNSSAVESEEVSSETFSAEGVATPWYTRFEAYMYKGMMQHKLVPASAVFLLLVTFGTSFAAGGTLPGDLLYPVKININEKLSAMFSFGAKSSAKTLAEQATLRLVEAEKLQAKNKLDDTTLSILEADFNVKAGQVKEYTDQAKAGGDEEGAEEVNASFEESLKSHQTLLVSLSTPKEEVAVDTSTTMMATDPVSPPRKNSKTVATTTTKTKTTNKSNVSKTQAPQATLMTAEVKPESGISRLIGSVEARLKVTADAKVEYRQNTTAGVEEKKPEIKPEPTKAVLPATTTTSGVQKYDDGGVIFKEKATTTSNPSTTVSGSPAPSPSTTTPKKSTGISIPVPEELFPNGSL